MPKEGTALGVHVEHKGCSAEQVPAVLVLGLLALTLLRIITGNQPAGRHWQEGVGAEGEASRSLSHLPLQLSISDLRVMATAPICPHLQ